MGFVYDRHIIDTDHAGRLKISVTVVKADDDESVQINIESGRMKMTHFLSMDSATKLAGLLVNAVAAYDRAVEAPSGTKTEA